MHSIIKYAGLTPGTDSDVYVLLATTLPASPTNAQNMNRDNACPENFFGLSGTRKVVLLLDHSHLGTLKAYSSNDRGTNWRQIDEVAVATPAAATGSTAVEFLVEGLRDFKLEWTNGGTAQSPWQVNLSLSDQRASAL